MKTTLYISRYLKLFRDLLEIYNAIEEERNRNKILIKYFIFYGII